ncbi:hypothetical protein BS17DRAFT_655325, partial [Gyrodon lividus]
ADVTVECLTKGWTSPIYAFFNPTPLIVEINGRCAHDFECTCARIQRYLDKRDATSTSNLQKHSKKCWGTEVVAAADGAKDVDKVRMKIVGGGLCNGTITALFEQQGKGKVTYSHRQHTCSETKAEIVRWVAEGLRPFTTIVSNWGILALKSITSNCTYQEYSGKVSFTMDAWTLPNHWAFIAFSVHLEHNGRPLSMPLDVIE